MNYGNTIRSRDVHLTSCCCVTLFRRKFFAAKSCQTCFFLCKLRSQHVVCRSGSDSPDSRCPTSFLWRMFITRSFLVKIANFCGFFRFLCSSWFTSQLDSLRRRRKKKKKLPLRFITILISFLSGIDKKIFISASSSISFHVWLHSSPIRALSCQFIFITLKLMVPL